MKIEHYIATTYLTVISLCIPQFASAQDMAIGSISGAFTVSPAGTAQYTIPLQIAPGTAGTQPKLSITYDSNSSTGVLGSGWAINGISTISRGPKTLYHDGSIDGVRLADTDALFLDGIRLVEVNSSGSGPNKVIEYRKQSDDISRIFQYGAVLSEAWFKVQTKGGIILRFDGANGSTPRAANNIPILWSISRIIDTTGNYIDFHYNQNSQGDYSVSSILYTGHEVRDESDNLISEEKPYASIDFEYESISRSIDAYIAGQLISKNYRLIGVTSRVSGSRIDNPSENGQAVMAYKFEYNERNTRNRFVLSKIRQFGEDGSELEPTEFTYSNNKVGWKQAKNQIPFAVLAEEENLSLAYRFANLRGSNHLQTDLLFSALIDGTLEAFAFFNNKGIWQKSDIYRPPFAFTTAAGTDKGAIIIDLNGDGRSDLLQSYRSGEQAAEISAFLATDEGWKSTEEYALPFLVSSDGQRVGKHIFAPFTGTKNPDVVFDVNGTQGFLKNTGSQWIVDSLHIPPVQLVESSRALDVDCNGKPELVTPVNDVWRAFSYEESGWTQMPSHFILPLPGDLSDSAIEHIDLNDDGCLDVLVASAKSNIYRALIADSSGWTENSSKTPPFDLVDQLGGDIGTVFMDVNLDGALDALASRRDTTNNLTRFAYSQTPEGWIDLETSFSLPILLNIQKNAPPSYAMIGDIDGDGDVDITTPSNSRTNFGQIFTNTPNGFVEIPEYVPPVAFTRNDQQDRGVRFVDMNADGLQDVIFRHDHAIDGSTTQIAGAYINTGNGWRAAPGLVPPYPFAADWITGDPEKFADVDGDGYTDLLYSYQKADGTIIKGYFRNEASLDSTRHWVEQTNSGLVPPDGFPFAVENEGDQGVRFVDLNGDARIDIIASVLDRKKPQNPISVLSCILNLENPADILQPDCEINRKLFVGNAFLNNGTKWEITPSFTSPIPFVFRPENESSPSVNLFVETIDIDGDRLSDLVANFRHPHDSTITINEIWKNTGAGWQLSRITVPIELDRPLRNNRAFSQWMDINGDGLVDLLYTERQGSTNNSTTWLSTGNGFTSSNSWKIPIDVISDKDGDQGFRISELDGDGLPDLIFSRLNSDGNHELGTYLNNGSTWYRGDTTATTNVPPFTDAEGNDLGVRIVDVDGNGLPDLIKSYNHLNREISERQTLLNTGRRSDLLIKIESGYNEVTNISYVTLLENFPKPDSLNGTFSSPWSRVYHTNSLENSFSQVNSSRHFPLQYPVISSIPPAYVVQSTLHEIPDHVTQQFYRYGDFRIHATALESLGYGWVEIYHDADQIVRRSEYSRDIETAGKLLREASCWVRFDEMSRKSSPPLNLCPEELEPNDFIIKIKETTNNWSTHTFTPSLNSKSIKVRQVQLTETVSESWELDNQLVERESTTITYDSPESYLDRHLNVIATNVTRLDGTSVETINKYEQDDENNWFLGRLSYSTVTKRGDPTTLVPKLEIVDPREGPIIPSQIDRKMETRSTSFTYDPKTGLLLSSTVEPGHSLAVTTTFKRDQYGNIINTTLSAPNEHPRTSSNAYDLLGRFIIETQNSLGHKTIYNNYLATGLPKTITDPNNFLTTYKYDGFGRVENETTPSGVKTIIRRIPGNKTDEIYSEDLNVAYAEQVSVGSLPPEIRLFNSQGRLLRTISEGFTLTLKQKGQFILTQNTTVSVV